MSRVYKPRRRKKDGSTWTGKKWWIEYRDEHGRKRTKAASTDKQLAKSALRKAEERVDRIKLGLEVSQPDLLLTELAEMFLADMEIHLRPRSVYDYRLALTELVIADKPTIPVARVSELKPIVLQTYQAKARQKWSARTVNRKVGTLRAMLNWAVRSQLLAANPIANVRTLPSQPVRKQRALTDEEVSELLLAADDETRPIWITFLETGLRKNELASLQWEDVDLERGALVVRQEVAKSKKSRKIPLRENVKQIFRERLENCESATGIVFPTIRGRGFYNFVLMELNRDLEAANIEKEGVHVHALRRTFATRLIRAGADPKTVQTLLGHATLELTLQLYTDAKVLDLRSWMDQLPDLEVREVCALYIAAG